MRDVPSPAAADRVQAAEVAARLRLSSTRLARRLRQQSGTGHTPSQLSALASVDRHGPLTLGALAEHERVAPPSITKVVAKLEADGLVERATDPTDRRVQHVTATKAGRDLLAETRRRKTTWLTARIRELPAEEQARLAAALDVLDHLTTQDDLP
jgi:DNA-binding MarR family transcriptional regulator